MLWPVFAIGVALLVPLVTRGSYSRLLEKPWRWGSFLVAGLGTQLALEVLPFPKSRWHDLGFGLLVMSYVLLVAFCARNTLIRGMSVVLVGVALNALAVTVNQGMPVKVPPDWQRTDRIHESIKHHPQDDGDHLIVITDIIVLRSPFDTVLSFGDLILAVGLCDVTYHASRRSRRRRAPSRPSAPSPPRRAAPRPAPVVATRAAAPALDVRRPALPPASSPGPPPVAPTRVATVAEPERALLPPDELDRLDRMAELEELAALEQLEQLERIGRDRAAGVDAIDEGVVRVFRA
jgi:hypothetical protein